MDWEYFCLAESVCRILLHGLLDLQTIVSHRHVIDEYLYSTRPIQSGSTSSIGGTGLSGFLDPWLELSKYTSETMGCTRPAFCKSITR